MIGLTDEVVAILNRESRGKKPDTLLFPSDHHKTYKATALRIGYHQPITLRDLRHCYATLSAQGTGDAAATQAVLGHSRLETTQRYLTRTASASTAVAQAMSAHRKSPTVDKCGDRTDPQNEKNPAQRRG